VAENEGSSHQLLIEGGSIVMGGLTARGSGPA
jgi:hypothetical protein